jgi:hypothetical protein
VSPRSKITFWGGSGTGCEPYLPVLAGCAAVALACLLAACGTPAGGDPGGRRLEELSGDAVFAAVPAGSTRVRATRTPARRRKPAFQGAGWAGPSVTVTFRSAAPPTAVYRFYARRARAAGWQATASGALGLADRWAKMYPDGAAATLLLTQLERSPGSGSRRYVLAGGIAPVAR